MYVVVRITTTGSMEVRDFKGNLVDYKDISGKNAKILKCDVEHGQVHLDVED